MSSAWSVEVCESAITMTRKVNSDGPRTHMQNPTNKFQPEFLCVERRSDLHDRAKRISKKPSYYKIWYDLEHVVSALIEATSTKDK